ncbi:unnamed protein product [Closterium sp. NIES-65]|nr:unnamed protein product [Closterium sp. NIES-65]
MGLCVKPLLFSIHPPIYSPTHLSPSPLSSSPAPIFIHNSITQSAPLTLALSHPPPSRSPTVSLPHPPLFHLPVPPASNHSCTPYPVSALSMPLAPLLPPNSPCSQLIPPHSSPPSLPPFLHCNHLHRTPPRELSKNSFSGPLPTTLRELPRLEILCTTLSRASVPSLTFATSSPHLVASVAPFTWSLNRSLVPSACHASCARMLDGNALESPIPTSLSGLKALKRMDVSKNKFSENFPTVLTRMTRVEHMKLSNNNFTGSIPASISSLASLTYLDLQVPTLTGSIPASMGAMLNLQYLSAAPLFLPFLSNPLFHISYVNYEATPCGYDGKCEVEQYSGTAFCRACTDFCDTCFRKGEEEGNVKL